MLYKKHLSFFFFLFGAAFGLVAQESNPRLSYNWWIACNIGPGYGLSGEVGSISELCTLGTKANLDGQWMCVIPTYDSLCLPASKTACLCQGTNIAGMHWAGEMTGTPVCESGFSYIESTGKCRRNCAEGEVLDPSSGVCALPEAAKEPPATCSGVGRGNPVNAGSGNKFEPISVYRGGTLDLALYYFSRSANGNLKPGEVFGAFRSSSYHRRLAISLQTDVASPPLVVSVQRQDGQIVAFKLQAGSNSYLADADINLKLTRMLDGAGNTAGWQLLSATGEVELYQADGLLARLQDTKGRTQTIEYDPLSRPALVRDDAGRQLTFTYDDKGRVVTLLQPDTLAVKFGYDLVGNLSSITWPDGTTRQYLYEDARLPNHLTGIVDENASRYATWTYDTQGRALNSEHAGGADKTTFAYATNSTTVTDGLGTRRTIGLTKVQGVLKSLGESQPGGVGCGPSASTMLYDKNGNVVTRTDFNGNVTRYTYDLSRNLETQRVEAAGKPESRTISTQWHTYWRTPVRVAEPLKLTTWSYNGDNGVFCAPQTAVLPRLDGGTQPIGVACSKTERATTDSTGATGLAAKVTGTARTWKWTYDAQGRVLTQDGPRTDVPDVSAYTYYQPDDADITKRGNLASSRNALGHLTRITDYDIHGNPLGIIDPNGVVTTLAYDQRQRLTRQTVGDETTAYTYDALGQLTKVTLPDGSYVTNSYDAAHRLTGVMDALGNRVEYTLDALGNRLREDIKDPSGQLAQTRRRIFDPLNRLAQEMGAQNQVTAYAYDANGNRTRVISPLGQVTQYGYDALNRLILVTDPALGLTRYTYDAQSRLTSVTDPRKLLTAYTADGLGNQTQQMSPDTGLTRRTFDAAGNRLTELDAKGQTVTTRYDALNRPTLKIYADNRQVSLLWDTGSNGIGRLAQVKEMQGSTLLSQIAYTYDKQGRITNETRTVGGQSFTTTYTYQGGRLARIRTAGGRELIYTRDIAGQVTEIGVLSASGSKKVISAVRHQPFGGLKSYTDGAGNAHVYAYNQDGRINAYTLGGTSWLLTHDPAGRITGQTQAATASGGIQYRYDLLDRLTGATLPSTSFTYNYDANGNRVQKVSGGSVAGYAIESGSNRLRTVGGAVTRQLNYDANGSLISDGVSQYGYDARGRMMSAGSSAGITQYEVNSLGQRIKKSSQGKVTTYIHDQWGRLLSEADSNGQVLREYVWLDELPVAVVE